MVAPVCVKDAQLRLERVTSLRPEIFHDLAQVIGIHGQPHLAAISGKFLLWKLAQPLKHRNRSNLRLFSSDELRKVLLTGLHGIDVIMPDFGNHFIGRVSRKDYEPRALDSDLGGRIYEPHAIDGRRRPLVKLPRKILHGNVFCARKVTCVRNAVSDNLPEHAVAALFEKLSCEPEKVIDIKVPEGRQVKLQVFVQFPKETACLDLKLRVLFNVNAIILIHN